MPSCLHAHSYPEANHPTPAKSNKAKYLQTVNLKFPTKFPCQAQKTHNSNPINKIRRAWEFRPIRYN
jgi:hypothetical protein